MARLAIKKETFRTLFARSGNQCAFPECTHPLIDDDDDFVAEICHIEGAEPGGERYNPEMTDEVRRAAKNLLVLCHRHHVKTNDVELFPVSRMRLIKQDHESKTVEQPYTASERAIQRIFEEQLAFEHDVSRVNAEWQASFDVAMDLKFHRDPSKHLEEVSTRLYRVEGLLDELNRFLEDLPEGIGAFLDKLGYDTAKYRSVSYYENPFHGAFWEIMNIGRPNLFNLIYFHLKAFEAHMLIQSLRAQPADTSIRARLDELKSELLVLSSTLAHVD